MRTALTALGVALGVVLLLFAGSVPRMVRAHDDRIAARSPVTTNGPPRLLLVPYGITFDGDTISGAAVQPVGSRRPPLPPGVTQLPGPGQMVVSPALDAVLHSSAGPALARQLGDRRVSGTISSQGLAGPAELYVYLGATHLSQLPDREHVTGFGPAPGPPSSVPASILTLLVVLMAVALLLPIGMFVATAARFGAGERDRRLAALRLVGANRTMTARVAAGETLLGSVTGVILGVAAFYAVLPPLTQHVQIAGISVFSEDVRPLPALLVLTVVLVPTASVLFALASMRRVAVEPLGVTRRGGEPRRRLWWRLAIPAAGFALLLPLFDAAHELNTTGGAIEASAGVVFVLVGICALLPWLVEAMVLHAGGGPLPWLLAVRRLRADHGTAGRVVGVIGVAVAGAIALQIVFGGVDAASRLPGATRIDAVQVTDAVVPHPAQLGALADRLQRAADASDVQVALTFDDNSDHPVTVATCHTIEASSNVRRCASHDVFVTARLEGDRLAVGARRVPLPARTHVVVIPHFAQEGLLGDFPPIVTPAVAAHLDLEVGVVNAVINRPRPATADSVQQRVRSALIHVAPLASVDTYGGVNDVPHVLQQLNHALTAGAVAVFVVIGFSLLVAMVEQLRERRRVLAVLAAFGTRTSTLAWSVLWQTGLLVLVGLGLAVALGIALGATLMHILNLPTTLDGGSIAVLVGAGALVTLTVTALTLPMLWLHTRPVALRTE